jgi:hypothetical protein
MPDDHGNAGHQSRNRTGLLENNFTRDLIKVPTLGCSSKNYQSVAYVLGEQLFYTAIQDLEIRFR